ncbi:MAG: yrrB 8 [Schlesneria sp.]|nr:yrrB 8 [Schlesneria sp.]
MQVFRFLQAVAATCLAVQPALAQYKIGDRLVVISQAEIISAGGIRQVLGRGQDVRVDDIAGDRLIVKNLAAGWIDSNLVARPEVAVGTFSDQIAFDPLDAGAFYARGITRANLNQYDLAIADFTQAIKLGPTHACGFIGRGNCYSNTGDPVKANTDYTEAIRLDPNSAIAFTNRARTWNATGDFANAITDTNEAIRLAPTYANAYSARAVAFACMKRFDEAFADCDRIATISPAGVSGFNDVAWVLAMSPDAGIRDGKRAVDFATKAVALTNRMDGNVLDTLAIAWAEASDFTQAVILEQQAIALSADRDRVDFENHLKVFQAKRTLLDDQIAAGQGPVPLSSTKPRTRQTSPLPPQRQNLAAKVNR